MLKCTNSFSLSSNPMGCSHVLCFTRRPHRRNTIQRTLSVVAEQALGGIRERVLRAILKLPSPRLGAQGFAGGTGPAWQVTAGCGQSLAGENGLTLLPQSQPGFSWSGQVREDEASEGGGGGGWGGRRF